MRKEILRTVTIALALALTMAIFAPEYASAQQPNTGAPTTAVEQPQEGGVNWSGTGYGVGALFANILYVPFKLTYAILGGIVGGGTYLVTAGNTQAADTVWRSAFGGDYVITPQMLAGQQPINFSGPTGTPQENTAPAPAMSSTNNGTIAPMAPLPSSGSSVSGSSASASSSGQPLDHGSGPANPANIE